MERSNDLTVMSAEELAAAERRIEGELAAAAAWPTDSDVERRVQEALAQPYLVAVQRGEDGFVARVPDLPGCMGVGPTEAAAIADAREAMAAWLESVIARGLAVPAPSNSVDDLTAIGR